MTNYFFDQRFLHGGDYNPDQWLDYPEILKKDLAYMLWGAMSFWLPPAVVVPSG